MYFNYSGLDLKDEHRCIDRRGLFGLPSGTQPEMDQDFSLSLSLYSDRPSAMAIYMPLSYGTYNAAKFNIIYTYV